MLSYSSHTNVFIWKKNSNENIKTIAKSNHLYILETGKAHIPTIY